MEVEAHKMNSLVRHHPTFNLGISPSSEASEYMDIVSYEPTTIPITPFVPLLEDARLSATSDESSGEHASHLPVTLALPVTAKSPARIAKLPARTAKSSARTKNLDKAPEKAPKKRDGKSFMLQPRIPARVAPGILRTYYLGSTSLLPTEDTCVSLGRLKDSSSDEFIRRENSSEESLPADIDEYLGAAETLPELRMSMAEITKKQIALIRDVQITSHYNSTDTFARLVLVERKVADLIREFRRFAANVPADIGAGGFGELCSPSRGCHAAAK